jgi:hypothetical protein
VNRASVAFPLDGLKAVELRYVLLFAVIAMIRNWTLPTAYGQLEEAIAWAPIVTDLLLFTVVVTAMLVTVRRGAFAASDWGIGWTRYDWFFIGTICVAGTYWMLNQPGFSWLRVLGGLMIVLQVVTYELVLRAIGMSVLSSGFRYRSLGAVVIIALLNAGLYSIVLSPSGEFSGITAGALLLFSIFYYYCRTISLFIFLLAAVPVHQDYGAWVALFSVLVFITLSATARSVQSRPKRDL